MERDLEDSDVMNYYWSNTGKDVQSFWITRSSFAAHYLNLDTAVGDFGLYDNQLLIKYDVEHLVVLFDLITENSRERRLFEALDHQIQQGFLEPFIAIEPENLEKLKISFPSGGSYA